MSSSKIFASTFKFVLAKLALGGAYMLAVSILLVLLMLVGALLGGTGIGIMFVLWACIAAVLRFFLMHYFGYLVKAGHVAVVTEILVSGEVPPDQVYYGVERVKERFLTTNVYFTIDKLVSSAVRQLQSAVGKVGGMLDFIPGMSSITSFAQMFIDIALGYVDECCLAWTFYNDKQGAFKSSADGVVIYFQNWKHLLKGALFTSLKAVAFSFVSFILLFIPVGLLFRALEWNLLIGVVVVLLITAVLKFAVLDSLIMISMMSSYFEVATSTVITFDLYEKLCKISSKFKNLFDKARDEEGAEATA